MRSSSWPRRSNAEAALSSAFLTSSEVSVRSPVRTSTSSARAAALSLAALAPKESRSLSCFRRSSSASRSLTRASSEARFSASPLSSRQAATSAPTTPSSGSSSALRAASSKPSVVWACLSSSSLSGEKPSRASKVSGGICSWMAVRNAPRQPRRGRSCARCPAGAARHRPTCASGRRPVCPLEEGSLRGQARSCRSRRARAWCRASRDAAGATPRADPRAVACRAGVRRRFPLRLRPQFLRLWVWDLTW